ncbi:unnamed protein product [Cuscuta epithymum]|uniref:Uncharacterized protein n=1 Tax=Cuscuta epithymum TaxID=186058 RepID=A0AAV0FJ60_9ASTE|nr:unnamed protein product [Cuscuta epithymum]CAH9135609.1 unnamed protein product [Cuscuta epithymum]
MNDRRRRRPLSSPINHHTTAQLLRHAASIFFSHLFLFLFMSSLIFIFRSNVHNGAHFLTSFVDRDPSLKSLLSRVDLSANHLRLHPHRRPFLHLTRVGTLNDDFLSGDLDRSLFHPSSKKTPNATSVILSNFDPRFGFSYPIVDNGIAIPQSVRAGFVTFKSSSESLGIDDNSTMLVDAPNDNTLFVDLQFLVKGLELGRPDVTKLLFLLGLFIAAYSYAVFAFLVTYTWVHGIVFVQVLDNLLGNYYKTLFRTSWDGANLGLRRLSGFVLMRWAVRDALSQLLGIWSFGEIEDQYEFLKISIRMKLMPFSDVAPWVKGHEKETLCFILSWFLVELLVGFIFAVDSWIAIVDPRKSGREVVKEGCHLLGTLLGPAIEIKGWEAMICGSLTKWILAEIFGEVYAMAFQSVMEVYFMIAWLVFYLAARSMDASLLGRTFGRRELEGFLEGIR